MAHAALLLAAPPNSLQLRMIPRSCTFRSSLSRMARQGTRPSGPFPVVRQLSPLQSLLSKVRTEGLFGVTKQRVLEKSITLQSRGSIYINCRGNWTSSLPGESTGVWRPLEHVFMSVQFVNVRCLGLDVPAHSTAGCFGHRLPRFDMF